MADKYAFPPIDLLNVCDKDDNTTKSDDKDIFNSERSRCRYTASVILRKFIESDEFNISNAAIPVTIGKNDGDELIFSDIDEMEHLLIAGISELDISACINSMIISMLYKESPEDVNFIMIAPNSNELDVYNGIPYLVGQVITDTRSAVVALRWTIEEMIGRYKRFSSYNNESKYVKVRDINAWNHVCKLSGNQSMKTIPRIVIVVNEISSLVEEYKFDFEDSLVRLSQLGRNVGIYLLISTNKPSSDVITGLVKENIPSKIAFAVSSKEDSKRILKRYGAESLSADGEMLFFPKGYHVPEIVQGCFVSDTEIKAVTNYIRDQAIKCEHTTKTWEKILDLERNFEPLIY